MSTSSRGTTASSSGAWPARHTFLVDLETGGTEMISRDPTLAPLERGGGPAWVSNDRTLIAFPIGHGVVRLCDATGAKLVDFDAVDDYPWSIAIHRASNLLGVGTIGGLVRLWRLDEVLTHPHEARPVRSIQHQTGDAVVAFSPDGQRMLVTTAGSAYVADLDGTPRFRWSPRGGGSGYMAPAAFFSPDGRWILGAAFDGVRRWPAHEEDLLRLARDHAARVGGGRSLQEYARWLGPPTNAPASRR